MSSELVRFVKDELMKKIAETHTNVIVNHGGDDKVNSEKDYIKQWVYYAIKLYEDTLEELRGNKNEE